MYGGLCGHVVEHLRSLYNLGSATAFFLEDQGLVVSYSVGCSKEDDCLLGMLY
jgi:hypothetical protein